MNEERQNDRLKMSGKDVNRQKNRNELTKVSMNWQRRVYKLTNIF